MPLGIRYAVYRYPKDQWDRCSAWLHLCRTTGKGGSGNNPYRKAHTSVFWCWEAEELLDQLEGAEDVS
jgi:hypothetical protein